MLDHETCYRIFMKLPRSFRDRIRTVFERIAAISYLLKFSVKQDEKMRILGVIDFNEEGFGIGDGLLFNVFLNILMIKHNAGKVDVCYIDDNSHHNSNKEAYSRSAELKRILSSLHEFNPNLGSVFHFDSNAQFDDFLSKSKDKYIVWPVLYEGKLSCRGIYDMKIVFDFYENNGYLPKITCRQEAINWAHRFRERYIGDKKLVVVQIRNNPTRRSVKNANIEAWDQFFAARTSDKDLFFVIIGMEEEVMPAFRNYKNVIFSKDHNTTFEQDCALLQIAHITMGNPSGPSIFTRFAQIPSLLFGFNPLYTTDIPEGGTYPFLTKYQKIFWGVETGEIIIKQFDALLDELDADGWKNPYICKDTKGLKHHF